MLYELNDPPINILPSYWILTSLISLSAPFPELNNESIEPSGLRRIILLTLTLLKDVKFPATIIFPSGWILITCTDELKPDPILKVLSISLKSNISFETLVNWININKEIELETLKYTCEENKFGDFWPLFYWIEGMLKFFLEKEIISEYTYQDF